MMCNSGIALAVYSMAVTCYASFVERCIGGDDGMILYCTHHDDELIRLRLIIFVTATEIPTFTGPRSIRNFHLINLLI